MNLEKLTPSTLKLLYNTCWELFRQAEIQSEKEELKKMIIATNQQHKELTGEWLSTPII